MVVSTDLALSRTSWSMVPTAVSTRASTRCIPSMMSCTEERSANITRSLSSLSKIALAALDPPQICTNDTPVRPW